MSLSTLPLSYCTNVHPGSTVAEVCHGLTTYTIPARQKVGQRIAAGLWLPASAIAELTEFPDRLKQLQQTLQTGDLVCYTLNAFPYGNFHDTRVKEQVYLPDWTTVERRDYTVACAQILSQLMPPGVEGSLSTVPLGAKPAVAALGGAKPSDPIVFRNACIDRLLEVATELDRLHDESGQVLRLAIEPEPCCQLETTAEAVQFFRQLFAVADDRQQLDIAQRHLGLCYDVCHQAVEFEDVAASIRQIEQADIRINKVHITCAIHIDRPSENPAALEQLIRYAEPRYLHQSFAKLAGGEVVHQIDLTPEMCTAPTEPFRQAEAWRVHFHVPVHREALGELRTTRDELEKALRAIAELRYAPHLEVETYTWGVLPGEVPLSLEQGLVNELMATAELLSHISK